MEVQILQCSCSATLHGIFNLKFCFSLLLTSLLLCSLNSTMNPRCFILPAKMSLQSKAAQVPGHKKPFSTPQNLSCCHFPLLSVVTHLFLGVKVRTTPRELKLLWSGWKEKLCTVFHSHVEINVLFSGSRCKLFLKKNQNYGKAAGTKKVTSVVT